jgi:hypothetical protein
MMKICPHDIHIYVCGNETDDIYKGVTRMEAEHLRTIAVNDSSETKESVLENVFYLPYQTQTAYILGIN